jgi:hypothetical protein
MGPVGRHEQPSRETLLDKAFERKGALYRRAQGFAIYVSVPDNLSGK